MTDERFLSLKRQYDTPEMHKKIKYSLAEKQWELYEEVKVLQEYAQEQGENISFEQACEIIKMYRVAKNGELAIQILAKTDLERIGIYLNK